MSRDTNQLVNKTYPAARETIFNINTKYLLHLQWFSIKNCNRLLLDSASLSGPLQFQVFVRKPKQQGIHTNECAARACRTQVFIGVRSTFHGVRRCACGGVLRNPNRPHFIGRQPETREAKGGARQQDSSPARIHVYPKRSIKFLRMLRMAFAVYFERRITAI